MDKRHYNRDEVGIGVVAALVGVTPQAVWKDKDRNMLVRRRVATAVERLFHRLRPAQARGMAAPQFRQLCVVGLNAMAKAPVLDAPEPILKTQHKTTPAKLLDGLRHLLKTDGDTPKAVWLTFLRKMLSTALTALKPDANARQACLAFRDALWPFAHESRNRHAALHKAHQVRHAKFLERRQASWADMSLEDCLSTMDLS